MPGKRPESPTNSSHDADARGESDADSGEQRVGPLAIARHVKDDGRALLLYTRREA
jgi:hypothetical protein